MTTFLYTTVILAALIVLVLCIGYVAVSKLMETDEDRLLDRSNKEFTNRPRVRAPNE